MIEYMIITQKTLKKLEEHLNTASREGWKVVCACGKRGDKIIMKRKVRREYD